MKTVLITGSSSGYGLETARHFHNLGWNVIATMRRPSPGILPASDRIKLVALDVTRADSIAHAVEQAGPIDVLVNNAGIVADAAFPAMTYEQWDRVLRTTLDGFFHVTQPLVMPMVQQKWGRIVNLSSISALRGNRGQANYAAAKAGVMALTRCAALEAVEYRVRVNAVAPSLAMHPHLAKVTSPELLEELLVAQSAGAEHRRPLRQRIHRDVVEPLGAHAVADRRLHAALPGISRLVEAELVEHHL